MLNPSPSSKPEPKEKPDPKDEFSQWFLPESAYRPVPEDGKAPIQPAAVEPSGDEGSVSLPAESNPLAETGFYPLPSPDLLKDYDNAVPKKQAEKIALAEKGIINRFFEDYQIAAVVDGDTIGASVTRFHVRLAPGLKMAAIESVIPNLRVALHGNPSVRFVPVIEGKDYSGIEVGNPVSLIVPYKDSYRALMAADPEDAIPMLIPLGETIEGKVMTADLAPMPHLLVAGSTGSGKSVFIHSLILSLIMRNYPDRLRLLLIDPKAVELSKYQGVPHLLCPVVDEPKKAVEALHRVSDEMERRYGLFKAMGVGSFDAYNASVAKAKALPAIVAVIEEYEDLMASAAKAERYVAKLAAKARASGIHLILATQRPSVQVITGDIKNNIPARVALMMSSQVDSRVVLDDAGAETLMGRGDLLAKIPGRKGFIRAQASFVSDEEIAAVVHYLTSLATPRYEKAFLDLDDGESRDFLSPWEEKRKKIQSDPLYLQIKKEVIRSQRAVTSEIKNKFSLGYNKASEYLSALESEGVVKSLPNGKKVVLVQPSKKED